MPHAADSAPKKGGPLQTRYGAVHLKILTLIKLEVQIKPNSI